MKKIIGILAVLAAGTTLAFADTVAIVPAPTKVIAPAMAEQSVTGTVKSVSLADMAKGVKSEIIVTDATGKDITVLVKATTTLYDADAKAIMLDKVAVGGKVSVTYGVSREGVNEAKSVKAVK